MMIGKLSQMRLLMTRLIPVSVAAQFALLSIGGCAKTSPGPNRPATAAGRDETVPLTADTDADTDADVAYYKERAAALSRGETSAIAQTDFARLRRGRLHFDGGLDKETERELQRALTEALKKSDDQAVLEITAKILADDQACIRSHMLRAVVLRRSDRIEEADFHRGVAIGLIDSIVGRSSGRGFGSAWTVFRVKEEYAVLKAEGCIMKSQALISHDGLINNLFGLSQPNLTLLLCASHHDCKHFPMEILGAAEVEDTISPKELQRITEDFAFSFWQCVCCVEYDCCLCFQKANWYSFSLVAIKELVGNARSH